MSPPAATAPSEVAAPRPRRGLIVPLFLLMVVIWGTTWLVIRVGLEYYPPFFSIAVRFLLAGPLLLLLMRLRGEPIPWQPRHQPFFLVVGFLSFTVSYGVVYWCEQYIPSGLTAILFALLPLFTGVLAHFWIRGERLGAGKIIGLAVGLLGIVLIHAADLSLVHPRAPLAAALMLVSPVVVSVSSVLTKLRARDFSLLAMAGIPMIYGGLAHAGVWFVVERHRPLAWSWPGVAAILYLAVFGSMITFAIYYWLLRTVAVSRLSLIAYLTPIIALSVGFLFRGETLTPLMLAGSALVLGGVAIANRS